MNLTTSNGWLPDVNFWLALSVARHEHHPAASHWWSSTDEPAYFCRVTQMGLLRLLTNPRVMGQDILTPAAAVSVYKQWLTDSRVDFVHDLPGTEAGWLSFMKQPQTSGNAWTDAWLAALAVSQGLRLVSFDRGMRRWPGLQAEILSS